MNNKKKFFLIYLFFFVIFSGYSISPVAEIPMGAEKFKNISVHYSIKGEFQNGFENFIQKDGKTFKETMITTKIVANTFKEHTIEIDDGINFYRINMLDKTGMKLPSLNKMKREMLKKNPHLFKTVDSHPFTITPPKGSLKLKETILDKECDTYLYNNKLISIWEEIILKETWEVLGKTIKMAETLELNLEINDSIFNIPKDISFDPPSNL